jgi:tetratricopeptide (TPR) repeat protein
MMRGVAIGGERGLSGIIGTSLGLISAKQQWRLAEAARETAENTNRELVASNQALEKPYARETARFELARQAIRLYHGDVSEDLFLKEAKFKGLRNRLLRGAADFYGRREALLKEQSDPASQVALRLLKKTAEAQKKYQFAVDLQEKIVRDLPNAAPYQRDLGRSLNNIADIYVESGELAKALAGYRRSAEIHQKLVKDTPSVTDYRNGVAFTLSGLGRAQVKAKRSAEAVESFRAAIAQRKQLPALSPGALHDMASNHASLAKLCGQPDSGLNPADAESETSAAIADLKARVEAGFRDVNSPTLRFS